MTALSLLCLVGLWKGTDVAVTAAARILTPQERIDKIAEVSKEYGDDNREYGSKGQIEISGVVRTWNSAPTPGHTNLLIRQLGLPDSNSNVFPDGTFHARIPRGKTYMTATAKGYAPALAGPFEAKSDQAIQGVELVLGHGFAGRIQLTDESGQPVQNAKMTGGYALPDGNLYPPTVNLITDVNGIALLDNAAAQTITLNIGADDFEPKEVQNLVLNPEMIRTIVLTKAQSTIGVVLSEATGVPIGGAEVHILLSIQGTEPGSWNDTTDTPDAISDAQGRFELNRLQRDCKYLLFIRAPGYAYRYVRDVKAGQRDIKVALGAKKVIHGKVIGDLSLLTTDSWLPGPSIGVVDECQYSVLSTYTSHSGRSPVTIRDGIGYFAVDDFWGQTVTLVAGGEQVRLKPDADSLDDIVIELRPPARRQVVLKFQVPAGGPALQGEVWVNYISDRAHLQGQETTSKCLDIQDDRVTCEIPVPSQVAYSISSSHGKQLAGYWFNEAYSIKIPAGNEPFTVDVPVYPAGAIYGRIFHPDGSMAENAQVSLMIAKEPDIGNRQAASPLGLSDVLGVSVDRGTFNATPLPLGGQYAIVAYEEGSFAMSDAFSLDDKNPIVQTDLHLPQGVDVEGRLLDVDGSPATNKLSLRVFIKRGDHSWDSGGAGAWKDYQWGWEYAQVQPNKNGRFTFKNVNPGPGGTSSVHLNPRADYQPLSQTIEDLRAPLVVQLKRGLRVTGTVVEDTTGLGVPGVEVYARAVAGHEGQAKNDLLQAEGATNDQGQFVFSNMAEQQYQLVLLLNSLSDWTPVVVTGGQDEPGVIRIRIPTNSESMPQKP